MNNKKPSWIVWEDEVILNKSIRNIIDDYETIDCFLKSVSEKVFVMGMEYNEIRDAVTIIDSYNGFNNLIDKDNMPKYYGHIRKAKDNFNEWFNNHLSANMLDLYNFYDSTYNTEKWRGERRFGLLSRTNSKGYTEMACLKAAVRFQHLQDNDPTILTSIGSAKMLSRYLKIPYWAFGEETHTYEYDIERSKEEFKICNNMRKREIKKQDDFIHAIFVDKDINKAYNIMPNNDKIDY